MYTINSAAMLIDGQMAKKQKQSKLTLRRPGKRSIGTILALTSPLPRPISVSNMCIIYSLCLCPMMDAPIHSLPYCRREPPSKNATREAHGRREFRGAHSSVLSAQPRHSFNFDALFLQCLRPNRTPACWAGATSIYAIGCISTRPRPRMQHWCRRLVSLCCYFRACCLPLPVPA